MTRSWSRRPGRSWTRPWNSSLSGCKNHGIELIIDPIPEGLSLECRPIQLSQVLLNLLNNAHDAVENLPERWVRLSITEHGEELELAVSDSGGGDRPEASSRSSCSLFSPPRRSAWAPRLGLSVSKGIIESHDGTLKLDRDSPNTRFVVRLPKRRKAI